MEARSRRVLVVALALLVVGSVMMPVVLADSHEYRISADGSVPIPEETKQVDREGVEGEFSFNAIKAVDSGEQFNAEVDGTPGGDSYRLRLEEFVDGETPRIRDFENMNGNGQATFTAPEDPGLYFLSAYTSTYESLYPIIVQKYSVTVDWGEVPSKAESGSEIDVSATVTLATTRGEQDLEKVDVVIANEETLHNETLPLEEIADDRSSFTFSGSVSVNEELLPPDDGYSVYVAARGPETLEGLRVPVGISEQRTFEVTEPSTPMPTPSPTTTSTQTPTTAPTLTPTTAPTPTPTTAPTPTPTTAHTPTEGGSTVTTTAPETPTGTDETSTLPGTLPTLLPNGTLEPADDSTLTETERGKSTPTETEGGIITPGAAETDSPGRQTTTDGQPGFTAITAVLVVLFGAALLRRR